MRIAATPRIFIESPKFTEAPLFVSWLNDPEVVKYSEQRHKQHTVISQNDYWLSAATAPPNGVHTIYLTNTEAPIGSVSYQIDQNNNIANVGIMIGDKSKWGHGYGFEAWQATCDYLFNVAGVRKIEAGCMHNNKVMIQICAKYDMLPEGFRIGHFQRTGKTVSDLMMFGKFKP